MNKVKQVQLNENCSACAGCKFLMLDECKAPYGVFDFCSYQYNLGNNYIFVDGNSPVGIESEEKDKTMNQKVTESDLQSAYLVEVMFQRHLVEELEDVDDEHLQKLLQETAEKLQDVYQYLGLLAFDSSR